MTKRQADILMALAMLGVSGVLYIETMSEKYQHTGLGAAYNAVFYPRILLVILMLLAMAILIKALVSKTENAPLQNLRGGLPLCGALFLTAAYGGVFVLVPFAPLAVAYSIGMGLLLGYRRFTVLLISAISVPVAILLLFEQLLGIPLP